MKRIQKLAVCSFAGLSVVALYAGDAFAARHCTVRPDLSKPLKTCVGAPICVSREELQVLIAGGQSDLCIKAAQEVPVTISEHPSGFSDIMRIRVRNPKGELVNYWTLHNALQN